MHVRPLHDRILVQRLDEGEMHVGGIIIPDSAKEQPQRGTVIAAGSGTISACGSDRGSLSPDFVPSLHNAASIASLLLTTEAVISQAPDDQKAAAGQHAGGMGGMY